MKLLLTGLNHRTAPVEVREKHPKTFIAITKDDPVKVEGALHYYLDLKKNKVPAEMHIYPVGGHGYGLRRTTQTMTTWSA